MLEQEQATYESRREELIKYYDGQWVLIHDDAVLGAYSTEQQAYEAALGKVGNRSVLIKRVSAKPDRLDSIPALMVGLVGGRT